MAYTSAPLVNMEQWERVTSRDKASDCECCRHWQPFVQCSQVDCLACPECTAWRELAYHASRLSDEAQRLRAALDRIANETCDHGAGFCPRDAARTALEGGAK